MGTKGEQTRLRILDTAARLFWTNSYHSIKVDQIVNKAGVNKASFYQYFKSKEDAAFQGIQYMYKITEEYVFEAAFKEDTDPIKRLEGIFKRIYLTYKNQKKDEGVCPGCPFVNLSGELSTQNERIRKKINRIIKHFSSYHQKIYEDAKSQGLATNDLDPHMAGKQMQGILNGATVSVKYTNRPEDLLDAVETAKILIGAV